MRSARGADDVVTVHDVQCGDTTYRIGYRIGQVEGSSRKATLSLFERSPTPISKEMHEKLSSEISKFGELRFVQFWCGETQINEPSEFLSMDLRGSYSGVETFEASRKCREKGWNFDFDTRRTFVVENNDVVVDGDEIGYCFGDAAYFELKFQDEASESRK